MTGAALEAAMRDVSAPRLRRHLEWFAGVRRDTGGPGEDRAVAYIVEQLAATGVGVDVHEFDAFLSYPGRASLEIAGSSPVRFDALTHSFAASTPAGGLDVDLVRCQPGELGSARGLAVVVEGLATPVTILQASRAGCAAVVFVNEDRAIHNMIGTTIWGTPSLNQLDRLPTLPAVSISSDAGVTLKQHLENGRRLPARLHSEVTTGWYRSKLPEVRIAGTRDPDLFCLVGGHYCAWDVGVTDNATGDACMLEMARLLWDRRSDLERGVRICWWPGHSHGRYSGSTWYADTFFTDLAEHCLAYYNIDSPGVRGATVYVARHTSAELEAYCKHVIRSVTGQPDAAVHRPSRAADQSFLANGIPSFSAYPFLPDGHPDRRPWTGGSANAWWWHTDADTLDKADVDLLAQDVRVGLAAVAGLTNGARLPYDHASVAREIEGVTRDIEASGNGHIDLTPIIQESESLAAALTALQERVSATSAHPSDRHFNGLMIRLSRILNPVIYSEGGRFQHDPAEWSPIMRATSRHTLTGLARAAHLPALEGRADYRFLYAQVVRERNRIVTALREARAAVLGFAES